MSIIVTVTPEIDKALDAWGASILEDGRGSPVVARTEANRIILEALRVAEERGRKAAALAADVCSRW